jgi:hypothetical protein
MNDINQNLVEDLIRLRDELVLRAFDEKTYVKDAQLAEVVFKINSCLYRGYPRKTSETMGVRE